MLTPQEKAWLERRKNLCPRCEFFLYGNPCVRYGIRGRSGSCEGFSPRGMDEDYRDASRFYARALEILACGKPCAFIHFEGFTEAAKMCGRYDLRHGCQPCEMRRAMLQAEKDMERDYV